MVDEFKQIGSTHIYDDLPVTITVSLRTLLNCAVLLDLHIINNSDNFYTITHSAQKLLQEIKKEVKKAVIGQKAGE